MDLTEKFTNKKIVEKPKKERKKSKISKELTIFLGLVSVLAVLLIFLINLGDEDQAKELNLVEPVENNVTYTPPVLDQNKIEEKLLEEDTNEPIIEEEVEIKEKYSNIENNITLINDIDEISVENQKEDEEKEKQIDLNLTSPYKNKIKQNLEFLRKNIDMKKNYFTFKNKNFYEGDSLLDLKIKEVFLDRVILQDKNLTIYTINFKRDKI